MQTCFCATVLILLGLPSAAQVEVLLKKRSGVASGVLVRFVPLMLILKDDTFLNSPKEKGEVPKTLLFVQPYNARLRDGSRTKSLSLRVTGQMTEGPTVDETVFLTPKETDLLLVRLNDLHRIVKRWEALKKSMSESEKERTVVFNPHSDIQVRAEMIKDGTIVWAIKIKEIVSIGFMTDLSQTVSQIATSAEWLKTGKLPHPKK